MGEGLDCMIALSWWLGEEQRRRVLEQGRRYYLGRLSGHDMAAYQGYKPSWYKVYLYTPEGDHLTDTGYKSSVVSRRHALLEPQRCSLEVIDHGPEGRGSRNGTYLLDQVLHNSKAVARPGDVIRLAASGPQFMVVGVRSGRQFITLEGGVPTSLPQPLASAIRSTSTMRVEDGAIVTPEPGRYRAGDMDVIVSRVDERIARQLVLMRIEKMILEVENLYYKERNVEQAYAKLRVLVDYEEFQKAIRESGSSSLQEAYEYLRQYMSLKGDSPYSVVEDSEVQRLLARLRMLIGEHLRSIEASLA